jgi:hypothetical protein
MRLIAWLLLLANIGFFAWYGIYAPVPMPADNKPSLPPAAHLILLREAAHSDEAAAFAAYENNTVTTTAENMPADTPTDTTVALLPPDTATDRKDTTVDVAETIAPEETVTPIEAVAAVGTVTAIEVVDNPEESIAPETSALFDLEHDAVLLENIMSANLEKEDMGLFTPTHSASDTLADTQQNIPIPQENNSHSLHTETTVAATSPMHLQAINTTDTSAHMPQSPPAHTNTEELPVGVLQRLNTLSRAAPAPVAAATDDDIICVRVGPYGTAEISTQIQKTLQSQVHSIELSTTEQSQPDATWVYLPPYATRADAEFVKTMLEKQGIKEHYVVGNTSPGYTHAISLGVYRNDQGAQKRLAELRSHGYHNVRAELRHKKVTLYWLTLKATPAQQKNWQQKPEVFKGLIPQIMMCK